MLPLHDLFFALIPAVILCVYLGIRSPELRIPVFLAFIFFAAFGFLTLAFQTLRFLGLGPERSIF